MVHLYSVLHLATEVGRTGKIPIDSVDSARYEMGSGMYAIGSLLVWVGLILLFLGLLSLERKEK